ncbi:MAG: hypothetical protein KIT36_14915 [Alphaproteobacteria bacterium]|nr:hypothetical protein [Alphaproteobacteria bacterium]
MRRRVAATLAAVFMLTLLQATPAPAQMPPEWPGAAKAVLGELEKGSSFAERPFKDEARLGWTLARKWRLHNNRNTEIVMAEYLAMVTLCRWSGCAKDLVAGRTIAARAAEVKAEKARYADAYAMVDASFAWLNGLSGPGTESAKKNAALWAKDKDEAAADFAISNIYALGWLLAREQPDAARQAAMLGYFGLFVNGRAWIGERCLDITKIATILDAPPKVETCN